MEFFLPCRQRAGAGIGSHTGNMFKFFGSGFLPLRAYTRDKCSWEGVMAHMVGARATNNMRKHSCDRTADPTTRGTGMLHMQNARTNDGTRHIGTPHDGFRSPNAFCAHWQA